MRNFFFSPDDGRLRAGWRILLFFALYYSISFLLLIIISVFSGGSFSPDTTFSNTRDLLLLITLDGISVVLAILVARRGFDRRDMESLGFQQHGMWRDLFLGFVTAFLMMTTIFGVMALAGWLTFDGFIWETTSFSNWALAAINMTLAFVMVGITEEMMMRGYVFRNIEEGLDRRWAILLSSLIFAVLHLANPGQPAAGAVTGIFLSGLVFAYAYVRTGQLWLAIGLHFGWNFFENTIFGFIVSGLTTPGLFRSTIEGPEFWTGGSFGPEAGFVLVPAILLGFVLINLFTRNR